MLDKGTMNWVVNAAGGEAPEISERIISNFPNIPQATRQIIITTTSEAPGAAAAAARVKPTAPEEEKPKEGIYAPIKPSEREIYHEIPARKEAPAVIGRPVATVAPDEAEIAGSMPWAFFQQAIAKRHGACLSAIFFLSAFGMVSTFAFALAFAFKRKVDSFVSHVCSYFVILFLFQALIADCLIGLKYPVSFRYANTRSYLRRPCFANAKCRFFFCTICF